jgi:hypothetical protein
MKRSIFTGGALSALFALLLLSAAGAAAAESRILPALTLIDLDGKAHALPKEWAGGNGILILGFAHDARGQMDAWREALKLTPKDQWIEAPVVGNVSSLIQPMIKAGMKGKYEGALRSHITPVFEGADAAREAAGPHDAKVVVLVIGPSGQIIASADGAPSASLMEKLHAAY